MNDVASVLEALRDLRLTNSRDQRTINVYSWTTFYRKIKPQFCVALSSVVPDKYIDTQSSTIIQYSQLSEFLSQSAETLNISSVCLLADRFFQVPELLALTRLGNSYSRFSIFADGTYERHQQSQNLPEVLSMLPTKQLDLLDRNEVANLPQAPEIRTAIIHVACALGQVNFLNNCLQMGWTFDWIELNRSYLPLMDLPQTSSLPRIVGGPLYCALSTQQTETVRWLLEHGCSPWGSCIVRLNNIQRYATPCQYLGELVNSTNVSNSLGCLEALLDHGAVMTFADVASIKLYCPFESISQTIVMQHLSRTAELMSLKESNLPGELVNIIQGYMCTTDLVAEKMKTMPYSRNLSAECWKGMSSSGLASLAFAYDTAWCYGPNVDVVKDGLATMEKHDVRRVRTDGFRPQLDGLQTVAVSSKTNDFLLIGEPHVFQNFKKVPVTDDLIVIESRCVELENRLTTVPANLRDLCWGTENRGKEVVVHGTAEQCRKVEAELIVLAKQESLRRAKRSGRRATAISDDVVLIPHHSDSENNNEG